MEFSAYIIAWTFYLVAAGGISVMVWRVLYKYLLLELALLLQFLMMAVLFTPWPVLPGQPVLAPAFIVAVMDGITEEPRAAIRALTPLVMAMLAAIVLSFLLALIVRLAMRGRKQADAAPAVAPEPSPRREAARDREPPARREPIVPPLAEPLRREERRTAAEPLRGEARRAPGADAPERRSPPPRRPRPVGTRRR